MALWEVTLSRNKFDMLSLRCFRLREVHSSAIYIRNGVTLDQSLIDQEHWMKRHLSIRASKKGTMPLAVSILQYIRFQQNDWVIIILKLNMIMPTFIQKASAQLSESIMTNQIGGMKLRSSRVS